MSDLIRREDAYESLLNGMVMTGFQSRALDCISEFCVPTVDAVEVVRCRECKHNAQPPDKGFAQCELDALIREPEFWCRAGERREDGDGDVNP